MFREWIRRLLARSQKPRETTLKPADRQIKLPAVSWIDGDSNPWGVPILDVRPVTGSMRSASKDPNCASNAISFTRDDGTGFIGVSPPVSRSTPAQFRYKIDRYLAPGALFIPSVMEHKWAIYFHGGKI